MCELERKVKSTGDFVPKCGAANYEGIAQYRRHMEDRVDTSRY